MAHGLSGSATCSWWKPPGAMDTSDADATRPSFSSSISGGFGRRSMLGGRSSAGSGTKSALTAAVDAYLGAPSADTSTQLYQVARRPASHGLFYAMHHSTRCLRLLDTLAEHLLATVEPPNSTSNNTEEEAPTQSVAPCSPLTQQPQNSVEIQQLLELCYLFSRQTVIGYPSHALCKLLQWLVDSIAVSALRGGCEHEVTLKLQLLVVTEMLKTSAGVRIYAKEMKKIKEFYRALTILLNSTEDAELLVFCMSILARLVLSESLGGKLFSDKNVHQAFALVFSVLEGSCHEDAGITAAAMSGTVLEKRSLLQMVSVDLLCDLADRGEILTLLEQHPKMASTIDNSFMTINLNGDVEQIRVAAHFLSSIAGLGHHFRKLLVKGLSDQDVLYRVLQATLHPSKLAAMATTELVLKVIGDDTRPLRSLFDSSISTERVNPAIAGMLRCVTEVSGVVKNASSIEMLSASEEYLHSVLVCHLLAKLSEVPVIRTLCVQGISLNQIATLIQVESTLISSVEAQDLLHFHPQLSIYLVALLSSLAGENSMTEKTKRTLNQFLQSSEVAVVLGAGLLNRSEKEVVVETLLLLIQSLASSANKRFHAFGLAEAIASIGQKLSDASDVLESKISSLEANAEAGTKTIGKLQTEMQQILQLQDDLKAQQDLELKELGAKFADQTRQKDEIMQKMRDAYEVKLREVSMQCESLGQHMNKKISALQQRESLLQETRAKRGLLEEENSELKHKVEALEIRIEEIAHAHSIAMEERKLREQELTELRDEMAAISRDYTAQREETESALEETKRLESELNEQKIENENTYKELVLLSKAHKALTDEKKELEREMDTMRDNIENMESLNISIQSRLQEKKELADQLERKMSRLDDAASASKSALEDEREKRRAVNRDLEELRKAHRKLEGDIAMLEIRVAEQRLVVESKDEQLRQSEEEIRHLANEVGKQAKLQALIHQLSSGGDGQAKDNDNAATAFLARDS